MRRVNAESASLGGLQKQLAIVPDIREFGIPAEWAVAHVEEMTSLPKSPKIWLYGRGELRAQLRDRSVKVPFAVDPKSLADALKQVDDEFEKILRPSASGKTSSASKTPKHPPKETPRRPPKKK